MSIQTGAPVSGYSHVLYHPIIAPEHTIPFYMYDETVESRRVDWKGQPRHMMFCQQDTTRDKLWRTGWIDITDAWQLHMEREASGIVLTPAEDRILWHLAGRESHETHKRFSAIVRDTETGESELRKILKSLAAHELVDTTARFSAKCTELGVAFSGYGVEGF